MDKALLPPPLFAIVLVCVPASKSPLRQHHPRSLLPLLAMTRFTLFKWKKAIEADNSVESKLILDINIRGPGPLVHLVKVVFGPTKKEVTTIYPKNGNCTQGCREPAAPSLFNNKTPTDAYSGSAIRHVCYACAPRHDHWLGRVDEQSGYNVL